ncbi:MAG TPA: SDR family oxidoreductase [Candidatus Polarisedimenticolia bacterium]|nr:SDR family oxidoreductase [Candidatus Polarisedimenticolia bacterium]
MTPTSGLADLLSLKGKIALVTGGGGGIGSAIVKLLLTAGCEVTSLDRPGIAAPEGAARLECDLASRESIDRQLEAFRREHGRLDILVHGAGIARDAVLWKLPEADWDAVMRINLDSAFLVLKRVVPWMRETGEGAIVLITSINGERGRFGQTNYAASKAGLIGLGRSAAREVGRFGIRVNLISPGMIHTPMTDVLPREHRDRAAEEAALGRMGDPEDVAGAVLFLVSPLARHITGQVLRVDGGQLIA